MSNLALEPKNMTEAMDFSKMLSESNMVPTNFKGKPCDVLVAVQWGYEIGLKPLQALQNLAVINGKPSIYGDAAIALVKADKRCLGISEKLEGEGDSRRAVCIVKRSYGSEVEETRESFSVEDAKVAKLWGKQGPWTQYPNRMLAMRARGFALRNSFPDVLRGVITKEEAEDYPTEPLNITPEQKQESIEAPKSNAMEITIDYERKANSLKSCTTIDDLMEIWYTFDLKEKKDLEDVKNEVKERINKSNIEVIKNDSKGFDFEVSK